MIKLIIFFLVIKLLFKDNIEKMEPLLADNDITMFYKYLNKAKNYFEFGSGGSTFQANKRNNIKKIYSVESDLSWHNKLKKTIKSKDKIKFIYNDLETLPNSWGSPGPKCSLSKKKKYSSQIEKIGDKAKKLDLILIDGRFRVACCLKSHKMINNNCLIAFDDFLNRKYYHIVLKYFDIVEKTNDNRMVILKKKNIQVPDKLIKKYEKDPS
tara:strand:- start:805 stop:1437 length:633 start_codon:yes stop_codon:yes gene_type:complete